MKLIVVAAIFAVVLASPAFAFYDTDCGGHWHIYGSRSCRIYNYQRSSQPDPYSPKALHNYWRKRSCHFDPQWGGFSCSI